MSILIKGMRMPENCGKCPFIIEEDIDFDICRQCGAGKNGYIHEEDIDGFPADCPLIDLGKHGDLIDRDALRAKFPKPKDMIDPQQALVHITGVWAEIDCADVVIEAEDG